MLENMRLILYSHFEASSVTSLVPDGESRYLTKRLTMSFHYRKQKKGG